MAKKINAQVSRATPRSLVDFVREKRRAGCKICGLGGDVLEQLAAARTKKINRAQQIEWLKTELGVVVSLADFESHHSGRHVEAA